MSDPISTLADFDILKDARDQDEVFEAEKQLVGAICADYTARDPASDAGMAVLAVVAGVSDNLKLEAAIEARQMVLSKVRRPSSARNLLRLVGTDVEPPRAAIADVLLTLQTGEALADDLPIPQYTILESTEGNAPFIVTDDSALIPAGSTYATVGVMHGERGAEILPGETDGTRNQVFPIISENIVQNESQRTLEVYVEPSDPLLGAGVAYDVLYEQNFADSGPADRHCVYQRDETGKGRIIFGDGKNGAIPTEGQRVRIAYTSGGGREGNVGGGTISRVVTPILLDGVQVSLTATNPSEAQGGEDEQSVTDARRFNHLWWRAQDRGCSLRDYEALCRKVVGVRDARASRIGLTTVQIAILASSSSGVPTSSVLSAVEDYLSTRKFSGDDLSIISARLVRIDRVVVARTKPGYRASTIEQAIRVDDAEFFDLDARKDAAMALFGDTSGNAGHAWLSDYYRVLEDVTGLDSADVQQFARVPSERVDTNAGTVTLSAVRSSATTVEETITVRMTGASTFQVIGSVSGYLGNGMLAVEFTESSNRVTFTMTGSGLAFSDTVTFTVSSISGNNHMAADECFVAGDLVLSVVQA